MRCHKPYHRLPLPLPRHTLRGTPLPQVHLAVPASSQRVSGVLTTTGAWGATASKPLTLGTGDSVTTISLHAAASDVRLWWPAGKGAQPLYNLTVSFTPSSANVRRLTVAGANLVTATHQPMRTASLDRMHLASAHQPMRTASLDGMHALSSADLRVRAYAAQPAPVTAVRRVGFRTFALVTGNDTDPAYVAAAASEEGTSSLGMFWRVNGAAIMPFGATPPDDLLVACMPYHRACVWPCAWPCVASTFRASSDMRPSGLSKGGDVCHRQVCLWPCVCQART
jgi:hypothetical protein